MTKKRIEENLNEDTIENLEEKEETIKTEEKIEETPGIDPNFGKPPLRVWRIEGNEILLIDTKGTGFRIPLPEKFKNAKPGDIVYL